MSAGDVSQREDPRCVYRDPVEAGDGAVRLLTLLRGWTSERRLWNGEDRLKGLAIRFYLGLAVGGRPLSTLRLRREAR